MTKLLTFVVVPLMLLALAGCQTTEKTTCCGAWQPRGSLPKRT